MLVEICANSYQSALNAQQAGADRIELCSELAVGGVTPSYGLIKKVTSHLTIPTHVLIRPRSGDFCYSPTEFDIMKHDIELCKYFKCKGIVSGVLHRNGTLDMERTKELVALARPMSFTFHRAFDWVKNPMETAKSLDKLNVERILTSGQELNAVKGMELLKKLNQIYKGIIIPASGINVNNIDEFKNGSFQEIHLSASEFTLTENHVKIPLNSQKHFDETKQSFSSQSLIKQIILNIHA